MNIRFILLLATLTINSCGGDNIESITSFLTEKSTNELPANNKPVPKRSIFIKNHTELKYQRNPFIPFAPVEQLNINNKLTKNHVNQPDTKHVKENLENYPLNTLKVSGTLLFQNELWGLIKATDGMIYRVKAGNYLGTNNGKIISISLKQINIQELFQDQSGAWYPQQAALLLNE